MKRILKANRLAKYEPLSDAELIVLYRQGDQPAIEEIVNRYHHGMLLYACAFVGAWLAQDVMQDTWEAVLKGLQDGSYKEEQHFNKYIKGIAFRRALVTRREERRFGMSTEEEPELSDDSMSAEEMLLKRETGTMLGRALRKVGHYAGRVFILHLIKGKSFKEICSIMHISKEVTARVLYFRTLREISRLLMPYHGVL